VKESAKILQFILNFLTHLKVVFTSLNETCLPSKTLFVQLQFEIGAIRHKQQNQQSILDTEKILLELRLVNIVKDLHELSVVLIVIYELVDVPPL
jgi:hypothetical protein